MWKNKNSQFEDSIPAARVAPIGAKMNPVKPVYDTEENVVMSSNTFTPLAPTPAVSRSQLGATLHFKGEISGSEDLHVDGNVEGLIQLEGRKLTVGANAKIVADIMAGEIIVYGNVKGNLCARERIEIKKDGSVVGELTTSRIMIEDGAYFKGSIEIDRKTAGVVDNVDRVSRNDGEKERAPSLLGGTPTLYLPSNKKGPTGD
jgi:cytoskeletal protein CcmA (bactofilin family)